MIINNSFDRLINVDKVLYIWKCLLKKTVELKGEKDIEVATFGGEKVRISLILGIAGNRGNFPSLLILKTKKEEIWKQL